jgi:hypothetical protein
VSAGDREEGVALQGPPIQRLHRDVGEREEVPLGSVEHVRDTAAVAVAGERHQAFDAVPGGLHADALLAEVQVLVLDLGPPLPAPLGGGAGGGFGGAHAIIIPDRVSSAHSLPYGMTIVKA